MIFTVRARVATFIQFANETKAANAYVVMRLPKQWHSYSRTICMLQISPNTIGQLLNHFAIRIEIFFFSVVIEYRNRFAIIQFLSIVAYLFNSPGSSASGSTVVDIACHIFFSFKPNLPNFTSMPFGSILKGFMWNYFCCCQQNFCVHKKSAALTQPKGWNGIFGEHFHFHSRNHNFARGTFANNKILSRQNWVIVFLFVRAVSLAVNLCRNEIHSVLSEIWPAVRRREKIN